MKRLLHMFHHGAAVVDDDGDDVETDIEVEVVTEDVPLSGEYQGALLAEVHGGVGFTPGISGTGFHFGNHQLIPVAGNDVDFGMFETPVAFQDLITFFQ